MVSIVLWQMSYDLPRCQTSALTAKQRRRNPATREQGWSQYISVALLDCKEAIHLV